MSPEGLISCVRVSLAILSISSSLYVGFWFIMQGYKLYKTLTENKCNPAE
jgi:hypothetical protein